MPEVVPKKDEAKFFIPILKRDDEKRMVYGYASTEALDSDGEIITKVAMQDALEQYMEFGAVREMHQHWAAGRAKEASFDEKGLYIGAKIVDDQAWEKVKQGVYNGFSVGGEAESRIGNKITKMNLKEISLVDRPANPECLIEVFKMDKVRGSQLNLELKPVIKLEAEVVAPKVVVLTKVEKLAQASTVLKGMGTLARLAYLYDQVESIKNEVKFEEEFEQDTASVLPGLMDEACSMIGDIVLAMAEEEVAEYKSKGEAMEKVEKGKKDEDVAERRKAMKEKLEARMKSYKDDMDKMEGHMGDLDKGDLGKEALDDMEEKLSKLSKGEDADDDKEDRKKVSKVVTNIIDRAVEKALKLAGVAPATAAAAEPAVNESELAKAISKLNETNAKLTEKLEKLEKTPVAPALLRFVDKEGKTDVVKMAKEDPAKLNDLIAKGELNREEVFKQILAGSDRQVIA